MRANLHYNRSIHTELLLPVSSLQLLLLFSHFMLTTGLIWTKIDSIQVTIDYDDHTKYKLYKARYEAAIAVGILLLLVRFASFVILYSKPSVSSIILIILDSIACLFISWQLLDSQAWYNYIYVLVFCV